MTIEERIEQEIKKNPELAKIFEKYPERKEMYKQKILDSEGSTFGYLSINPKYCETCIFSHGPAPFADLPRKAHCIIYRYEDNNSKPDKVYYDGQLCEYYNDGTDNEDAE